MNLRARGLMGIECMFKGFAGELSYGQGVAVE